MVAPEPGRQRAAADDLEVAAVVAAVDLARGQGDGEATLGEVGARRRYHVGGREGFGPAALVGLDDDILAGADGQAVGAGAVGHAGRLRPGGELRLVQGAVAVTVEIGRDGPAREA